MPIYNQCVVSCSVDHMPCQLFFAMGLLVMVYSIFHLHSFLYNQRIPDWCETASQMVICVIDVRQLARW